ncbi:hypothetical protein CCHR01_03877 [Colletotrichum chrysophilum]|uniref:Uncharacterized protein n=1 Tax=Colletotrichum chrysophilum TaxID=1836956 RepID=A0AAD9AVG0_9PEZI|nr:hypothetical protein CCHR01_03877 [Colletotrichum chrysophilum]
MFYAMVEAKRLQSLVHRSSSGSFAFRRLRLSNSYLSPSLLLSRSSFNSVPHAFDEAIPKISGDDPHILGRDARCCFS